MTSIADRLNALCRAHLGTAHINLSVFVDELLLLLPECRMISAAASDDPPKLHFRIGDSDEVLFPVKTSFMIRAICARIATVNHDSVGNPQIYGGTRDIRISHGNEDAFTLHADFDNRPGRANQWFCLSLTMS